MVNYLFVSHYHQDHIGCVPDVLGSLSFGSVVDRGHDYKSSFYDRYAAETNGKRISGTVGTAFTLDSNTATPVQIKIVSVNANGKHTTNENDLSLSALISYGGFRAEIGGDLSGDNTENYIDVESSVAASVGKLDVYKVHHHCSSHSSNDTWLEATKPTIAIISEGNGNTYGHPAPDCLERLHAANVKTYWTERGNGGDPEAGWDLVAGDILLEVDLGAQQYTVKSKLGVDTYSITGGQASSSNQPTTMAKYAWSKNSSVYHYANCSYVASIQSDNLLRGNAPPAGKTLHTGCPLVRGH
jgi:hypothetical protein